MLNPFKALGDLNQMRKSAMAIQQALEAEEFEAKSGNVRILISGNQNVRVVEIDGVANEDVRRAINDAIRRSQQAAAGKLSELTKNLPQS